MVGLRWDSCLSHFKRRAESIDAGSVRNFQHFTDSHPGRGCKTWVAADTGVCLDPVEVTQAGASVARRRTTANQ